MVRVRVGTGAQGKGQSQPLQPQVQAQSINLSGTELGPGAVLAPEYSARQQTAGLACARLAGLVQVGVHVDVEGGRVAHPRQHA